ncbi:MAG: anti-sigma F factor antagonist [Christensenellales bacterium]|jgi:stage II sporulation protein AA (anti-sigma F factor antagonist)
MQLAHRRQGDTLVVRLMGELDHHQANSARQGLDQLLADTSVKQLVLDMQGVGFMDSAGIGVIMGRYKLLAQRGGKVAVRGVNPRMDRIFKMSGLYRIVEKINA